MVLLVDVYMHLYVVPFKFGCKLDLWIENSYNKIAGMIFIVQDNKKRYAKTERDRGTVINKKPFNQPANHKIQLKNPQTNEFIQWKE